MTKVVGLIGSPQKDGNAEKLLARFLAGAQDAGGQVSQIRAAELGIAGWVPGIGCQCGDNQPGGSVYETVSRELVAADVIVAGTPVYFRNVPAQFKALIDCSQGDWERKYLDKIPLPASSNGHQRRRGILIAVGGNMHEDFVGMVQTIKSFFAVYSADYWGEIVLADTEANELKNRPAFLQTAYDLGRKAVSEEWK